MSTALDEKLSLLVKDQLPEFVRDNYDTFKTFLEQYYEFSEQSDQVQYNVQKAKDFANIDETANAFVDYFLSQYAYNLPKSIFLNQVNQAEGLVTSSNESKRAFAKKLTEYHGNKGNEGAIKLLYRLLFDEEITFYYPKEDMFRPSDSQWIQDKTMFLYSPTGNVNFGNYEGAYITGTQSGASVVLDELYSVKFPDTGNIVLYEMKIDNKSLSGTFTPGEVVDLSVANLITGNIELVANARFYNAITSFDIVDSGSGYTADIPIYIENVFITNYIGSVTRVGPTGKIRKVEVDFPVNLNEEYNLQKANNYIVVATLKNYLGNFEANSNIATIVITESGNSITHGLSAGDTINLIFTSGVVLSSNTYTVNRVLSPKKFTVADLKIYNGVGNVTLEGRTANIFPNIGAISNYKGMHGAKTSNLRTDKYLQDSDYYQDYSYVVRATQSSALWKDIVRKSIHPAGLKLISEVFITIANAFTATTVTAVVPASITLLRLTITQPFALQVPTRTLFEMIRKFVLSVRRRDVINFRPHIFYYQDFDRFKFYNTSLRAINFENLTFQYIQDNYYNYDNLPGINLSTHTYRGESNIILNSNFLTSSDWKLQSGFAINNSNLEITSATANAHQQVTTEGNNKYWGTFEILSADAGSITLASNTFVGTSRSSPGRYTEIFWADSDTANIVIVANGFTGNVSNVYVKKLVLTPG